MRTNLHTLVEEISLDHVQELQLLKEMKELGKPLL